MMVQGASTITLKVVIILEVFLGDIICGYYNEKLLLWDICHAFGVGSFALNNGCDRLISDPSNEAMVKVGNLVQIYTQVEETLDVVFSD